MGALMLGQGRGGFTLGPLPAAMSATASPAPTEARATSVLVMLASKTRLSGSGRISVSATAPAYHLVTGQSTAGPPAVVNMVASPMPPMLICVDSVSVWTTGPGLAAANGVGVRVPVAAGVWLGDDVREEDGDTLRDSDAVQLAEAESDPEVVTDAEAVVDAVSEGDGDTEAVCDDDSVAEVVADALCEAEGD